MTGLRTDKLCYQQRYQVDDRRLRSPARAQRPDPNRRAHPGLWQLPQSFQSA